MLWEGHGEHGGDAVRLCVVVAQEVGDTGAGPGRDEEGSLRRDRERVSAEGVGVMGSVEAHRGRVRVGCGDEVISAAATTTMMLMLLKKCALDDGNLAFSTKCALR